MRLITPQHKIATSRDLLSLIGHLNHVATVVRPGHSMSVLCQYYVAHTVAPSQAVVSQCISPASIYNLQHMAPYHEFFACSISALPPLQFLQHVELLSCQNSEYYGMEKLSNELECGGIYLWNDVRYIDRLQERYFTSVGLAQAHPNNILCVLCFFKWPKVEHNSITVYRVYAECLRQVNLIYEVTDLVREYIVAVGHVH